MILVLALFKILNFKVEPMMYTICSIQVSSSTCWMSFAKGRKTLPGWSRMISCFDNISYCSVHCQFVSNRSFFGQNVNVYIIWSIHRASRSWLWVASYSGLKQESREVLAWLPCCIRLHTSELFFGYFLPNLMYIHKSKSLHTNEIKLVILVLGLGGCL